MPCFFLALIIPYLARLCLHCKTSQVAEQSLHSDLMKTRVRKFQLFIMGPPLAARCDIFITYVINISQSKNSVNTFTENGGAWLMTGHAPLCFDGDILLESFRIPF